MAVSFLVWSRCLLLFFICASSYSQTTPKPTPVLISCGEYDIMSAGDTMTVSSFNYPQNYSNSQKCYWGFICTTKHATKLIMTFKDFSVEDSPNCTKDVVLVHEGNRLDSPVIGRLCGPKAKLKQSVFVSKIPKLMITFDTNYNISDKGFQVEVTCPVPTGTPPAATSTGTPAPRIITCGEFDFINPGSSVTIHSSNHPQNYKNNQYCVWAVACEGVKGVPLTLNFTAFHLQGGDGCHKDYLVIKDGTRTNSTIIGHICGTVLPKNPYKSTDSKIQVNMHTDANLTFPGFRAVVSCPEVTTTTKSTTIVTTTATTATTTTATSTTATTRTSVSSTKSPTTTTPVRIVCGEFNFMSGGDTIVVSSLNFPISYTNNENCFYGFHCSAKNVQLTMNFTTLDVEASVNCTNDVVVIRDGTRRNAPIIARLCGNRTSLKKPPVYTSTDTKFFVQFRSNDKITRKGFEVSVSCPFPPATTQSTPPTPTKGPRLITCGEFNTIDGGETVTLQSPNFPTKNYTNNEYCVYAVACQRTGVRLTMKIASMDIEQSVGCRKDYLLVRDGTHRNSTILGHFCGSNVPTNAIISSGPKLMLNFLTNNNVTKKGFNATVSCPPATVPTETVPTPQTAFCGEVNMMGPGETMSTSTFNFPQNYTSGDKCFFGFVCSRVKSRLTMKFTAFQVEQSTNCTKDVAIVRDGTRKTSKALARLCGSMPKKNTFLSSGPTMMITFITDATVTDKGFEVTVNCPAVPITDPTYTVPTNGPPVLTCGEFDFIGPGESIKLRSSNYPNNYNNNEKCVWAVVCSAKNVPLTLNFTTFDLDKSTKCGKDYVHLRDGTRKNSSIITTLCGSSLTKTVYKSSGPKLQVNMGTDGSVVKKGFEAVVSCPATTTTSLSTTSKATSATTATTKKSTATKGTTPTAATTKKSTGTKGTTPTAATTKKSTGTKGTTPTAATAKAITSSKPTVGNITVQPLKARKPMCSASQLSRPLGKSLPKLLLLLFFTMTTLNL